MLTEKSKKILKEKQKTGRTDTDQLNTLTLQKLFTIMRLGHAQPCENISHHKCLLYSLTA